MPPPPTPPITERRSTGRVGESLTTRPAAGGGLGEGMMELLRVDVEDGGMSSHECMRMKNAYIALQPQRKPWLPFPLHCPTPCPHEATRCLHQQQQQQQQQD